MVLAMTLFMLGACDSSSEHLIVYRSSYIHGLVVERLQNEGIEHRIDGRSIFFYNDRVFDVSREVSTSKSQIVWHNRDVAIEMQKVMKEAGVDSYLEQDVDGTTVIFFDTEHNPDNMEWVDEAYARYKEKKSGTRPLPPL
jgi:hypothetical protein